MASNRLKRDKHEVRGETFNIREWTSTERKEFLNRSKADLLDASIYIAHRCTLKDDGSPMWPKEEQAGGEPPEVTDALMQAICRLSGLDPQQESKSDGGEPAKKD